MSQFTVRVGQTNSTKVLASDVIGRLNNLQDVDAQGLSNGSVLVYDSNRSIWVATNTLTEGSEYTLEIDGGTY
jgi:hypothetical protein